MCPSGVMMEKCGPHRGVEQARACFVKDLAHVGASGRIHNHFRIFLGQICTLNSSLVQVSSSN